MCEETKRRILANCFVWSSLDYDHQTGVRGLDHGDQKKGGAEEKLTIQANGEGWVDRPSSARELGEAGWRGIQLCCFFLPLLYLTEHFLSGGEAAHVGAMILEMEFQAHTSN